MICRQIVNASSTKRSSVNVEKSASAVTRTARNVLPAQSWRQMQLAQERKGRRKFDGRERTVLGGERISALCIVAWCPGNSAGARPSIWLVQALGEVMAPRAGRSPLVAGRTGDGVETT